MESFVFTRSNYFWVFTRSKVVSTNFGTRSKVLKAKNTIMRTFNLVPKLVLITFGTRPKVFKAKNTIIRAFDLVPKSVPTTFGTRPKVFKLIELVPVANF